MSGKGRFPEVPDKVEGPNAVEIGSADTELREINGRLSGVRSAIGLRIIGVLSFFATLATIIWLYEGKIDKLYAMIESSLSTSSSCFDEIDANKGLLSDSMANSASCVKVLESSRQNVEKALASANACQDVLEAGKARFFSALLMYAKDGFAKVSLIDEESYDGPFAKSLNLSVEPVVPRIRVNTLFASDSDAMCSDAMSSLGLGEDIADYVESSRCTGFAINYNGSRFLMTAAHCLKLLDDEFRASLLIDEDDDFSAALASGETYNDEKYYFDIDDDIEGGLGENVKVETLVFDNERDLYFHVEGKPFYFEGRYFLMAQFLTPHDVAEVDISGTSGSVVLNSANQKAVGVVTRQSVIGDNALFIEFSPFGEALLGKLRGLQSGGVERVVPDEVRDTSSGLSLAASSFDCAQLATELLIGEGLLDDLAVLSDDPEVLELFLETMRLKNSLLEMITVVPGD